LQNALRKSRHVRRLGEHNKLVTTDSRDRIDVSGAISQPLRNLPQQYIAGLMAECVIGDLEPIKVDTQDRETLLVASRASKRLIDTIVKQ
jgi:hypothetical protein